MEASGIPVVLDQALDMVSSACRVVVVGMSADHAPLRPSLLPAKEIDVLGASCCDGAEFAAAVELVARHAATVRRLASHELPLAEADRAIDLTKRPEGVMKVLVSISE